MRQTAPKHEGRIPSHTRVERRRLHRLPPCHLPSPIFHLPSSISHLPSPIFHLPSHGARNPPEADPTVFRAATRETVTPFQRRRYRMGTCKPAAVRDVALRCASQATSKPDTCATTRRPQRETAEKMNHLARGSFRPGLSVLEGISVCRQSAH